MEIGALKKVSSLLGIPVCSCGTDLILLPNNIEFGNRRGRNWRKCTKCGLVYNEHMEAIAKWSDGERKGDFSLDFYGIKK